MSRDPHTLDDVKLGYVLGELAEADAVAFERALATDAGLAAEVRELRRAFGMLPYAAASDPPRDLRARILAAAERADSAEPPADRGAESRGAESRGAESVDAESRAFERIGPRARSDSAAGQRTVRRARGNEHRRSWWPVAAAIAAGVAIVFALDARALRRDLTLEREVAELLQQPNVIVSFALTGTGTATSAYGSVLMDMDGAKGALSVRGVPAPPSGHVYRLWAVSAGKDVLCGQFTVDPEHAARTQFVVPVRAYEGPVDRVFVTLEPLDETAGPTGPRVLEST
jgi:anti-sigma-K factor RskA